MTFQVAGANNDWTAQPSNENPMDLDVASVRIFEKHLPPAS